jgi:hypothetical protein
MLLYCRRVFLLVDSRRGVSDSDRTMMDMLNKAGLTYQVCAVINLYSFNTLIVFCGGHFISFYASFAIRVYM